MSGDPMPITNDHDLIRRAIRLGWQIVHYPGMGCRLVPPHTIAPHHPRAEVSLVTLAVQQRLPALLALLNADLAPPPVHPTPTASATT